jgi:lipoate-protein ligase A
VIAPIHEPRVTGTVLESYQRLAQALVEALKLLEMHVEVNENSAVAPSSRTNPVCFEVPSSYEITVEGRKLIGSAQARRKEGVLQHGSLPLNGDLTRILQVLAFPDEEARTLAAERLLRRAITVRTALKRKVSWDEAAQAVVTAFETVLALDLCPGNLTLAPKNWCGTSMRIRPGRKNSRLYCRLSSTN